MAKTKKRPVPGDMRKKAGITPASQIARMDKVEEMMLEEEIKKEEKEQAEDLAEETAEDTVKKTEPSKEEETALMCTLLKRLMDDMGAESLSALSRMIDAAERQKLVRTYGFDEQSAEMFLVQQEKVRALREAEAKAAREAIYAEMKNSPMYDDVDGHKEAIEAFIFRTGVTPKEAYNALFGEARFGRLQKDMESEKAAAEKKARHIPALAGGDAQDKQGHIKLSEAERWAAKRAGMTPEEYVKYKYAY